MLERSAQSVSRLILVKLSDDVCHVSLTKLVNGSLNILFRRSRMSICGIVNEKSWSQKVNRTSF